MNRRIIAALLASLVILTAGALQVLPTRIDAAQAPGSGERSGLMFIENVGQFGDGARFQLRGGRATVWLAEDAIWITLLEPPAADSPADRDPLARLERGSIEAPVDRARTGVNLRLTFNGANPSPTLEPLQPLTTTVSYFLGNDPDKWRPAVPVWGGLRYASLYPGLDLELAGRGGELALQMVCHAADCRTALDNVQLQVEGADGIALEDEALRLTTAVGDLRMPLLEALDAAGRPVEIDGPAILADDAIVGRPFAPDPSPQAQGPRPQSPEDDPADLLYGTFLGGGSYDRVYGIAVNGAGSTYVTGYTWSDDFPTTPGAFDISYNGGGWDAFVVKLNPASTDLVYATFLGGGSNEIGVAIALDGAGSAYVTGETWSSDFPTTPGAFDTSLGGMTDAFVVKLNPAGSDLSYATFLGGSGYDRGPDLAVDGAGSAHVTGHTSSADFPTTPGAFDTSYNGSDAFVVKFNPAGSDLVYATFLGGGEPDWGWGIAVDSAGSSYVTGSTDSWNFPTTPGAFDMSLGGTTDAFVVKLNPAGSDLSYATFLGGSSGEIGLAIALDGAGNAYVTGDTWSDDFPTTPGAFDNSLNGGDAFVVKFNSAGSDLVYATFLGGDFGEEGLGLAIDGAGSVYATGSTDSWNFPTTPGAFDTSLNDSDGFVVKFNQAGSDLSYATFLGGSSFEHGSAIALDGAGSAYVTGDTSSSDFPTTPGAFDTSLGGTLDAFLTKLAVTPLFVGGPTEGLIQTGYVFTATVNPISPTLPFTYTWQATEQQVITHTAGLTDTIVYEWSLPGPKVITVMAVSAAETYSATHPILLYAPPIADFTAEPTAGVAPLTVQFTNLATGDYDTCLWEFGDGPVSSDCGDPAHTYLAAGTYTVSLTVSGPGGTDILVRDGYITVYAAAVFIPVALRPE